MNRTESLIQALPTWCSLSILSEIIIVDWSSTIPIQHDERLPNCSTDIRIKWVRIDNAPRWTLSCAYNVAMTHVTGNWILKVDSDTHLNPNVIESNPLVEDRRFYCGNWRRATASAVHINGVVLAPTLAFQQIGGYNEWIQTYGWDDDDLYERLETAGWHRHDFAENSMYHINHIRGETQDDRKLLTIYNMYLSRQLPWTATSPSLLVLNDTTYVSMISASDSVYRQCKTQALRTVLNDHFKYTWGMTQNYVLEDLEYLYEHRHTPRLIVQVLNGLGNRLRAMAAACLLGIQLKRVVIIVWESDIHLRASWSQCFSKLSSDYDGQASPICDSTATPIIVTTINTLGRNNLFITAPESIIFYDATPHRISEVYANPPGDIYMKSASIFGIMPSPDIDQWIYKNCIPLPHLQQRIDAYIERAIGSTPVHIRMGQANAAYESTEHWSMDKQISAYKWRAASYIDGFVEEMGKYPSNTYFLMSDRGGDNMGTRLVKLETAEPIELFTIAAAAASPRIWSIPRTQYDRSLDQIHESIVEVWVASYCQGGSMLGSQWSTFTELIERLRRARARANNLPIYPTRIAGRDFTGITYGLLFYPNSYNIGDTIQSWAARPYIPTVHYLLDRDHMHSSGQVYHPITGGLITSIDHATSPRIIIRVLANGWYDSRMTTWPPHKSLELRFISFHLNDDPTLGDTPTYRYFQNQFLDALPILRRPDTIIPYAPIGARDYHTWSQCILAGVPATLTYCLTLTLKRWIPPSTRTNAIVMVDVESCMESIIPAAIRESAIRKHHALPKKTNFIEKEQITRNLLELYQTAKCVVTSRLHVAFPCLAMNTPVLFLLSTMQSDVRFDAFHYAVLGRGDGTFEWDWNTPTITDCQRRLVDTLDIGDIASRWVRSVSH